MHYDNENPQIFRENNAIAYRNAQKIIIIMVKKIFILIMQNIKNFCLLIVGWNMNWACFHEIVNYEIMPMYLQINVAQYIHLRHSIAHIKQYSIWRTINIYNPHYKLNMKSSTVYMFKLLFQFKKSVYKMRTDSCNLLKPVRTSRIWNLL